jgi:hypothetical protein
LAKALDQTADERHRSSALRAACSSRVGVERRQAVTRERSLLTNSLSRALLLAALALIALSVGLLMRMQFSRHILPRALIWSILSGICAVAAIGAAFLVQA